MENDNELTEAKKQIVMLREYLEKLACLGNGTRHGNSVGNVLAIDALAAIDKDLSGCILCDAEPIAVYHGSDKGVEQITLLERIPEGTELYKAKEMK